MRPNLSKTGKMASENGRDLTFGWSGLTLSGTLHVPAGHGPHPVVLMMQGSGPADRDADGYFAPIREAFLSRRLATYSFDKPGCSRSTGDWRDYALEDRVSQAFAALESLRDVREIDGHRTGIWGQSQGGWLVQMMAGRDHDLSFAIANSGPTINVPQQNAYGCEHTMRAEGYSKDEIDQALDFVEQLHEAARLGADYATVDQDLLRPARGSSWYGYISLDDPKDWDLGSMFVRELFEPLDALSRVECPFLAIYGGHDVLLPPWQSAEGSGRALQEAGNADATIVVFPDGDHRIQDRATGVFVAGYLDLLADWAARRAGTT